jgi:ComB9 competence protein
MTRIHFGGVPPLSEAWEHSESLFLSRLPDFGKATVVEEPDDGEKALDADTDWKPLTFRVLALALLLSSSLIAPALAQTAIGGNRNGVPMSPPGKTGQGNVGTQGGQSAQTIPAAPPMPASAVFQAVDQSEGIFPQMARAGAGGQVQDAWNVSEPREGVYAVRMCDDCVYKVRVREFMTTTIMLPPDAVIAAADLGDTTGFQATVKFSNMVAVRPATYGVDTNLNVYTKSGKVYPFYLRAESFNSINVPDLMVRVLGRETPDAIAGAVPMNAAAPGAAPDPQAGGAAGSAKPGDKVAAAVADLTNPKPQAGDFVRTVPFDPSKLRGWNDYKLWGGGDAERELKPVMVYRDDFFTYLQYGRKFDGLELPTAYVVRDGIDELVNSRVQGNTFIVESTAKVISLKNGKSFICVEYTGETP